MSEFIPLVERLGSLALLGYLIFWSTRVGGPSFLQTMNHLRKSIDRNTQQLMSMEEQQNLQTEVLIRLVELRFADPEAREVIKKLRREDEKKAAHQQEVER